LHTKLNDLLSIKYPIIQGGMAWIATGELAAAVSESGGLGIIGAGNAPAEVVREEIRKVKRLTSNDFGVNVYYMSPFVEEIIQVIVEEKVPVVTTGAGNPGKHIEVLKNSGCKVFPVVASAVLAKRLEKLGVDGFIAEGTECGGHVGELTTMVLVPQIVDAVSLPVIAAGGICDGRGMAAALSLGAVGVQIGTRFVACKECRCNYKYKEAIINAKERDAVLTGTAGHKVRSLKNKLTKKYNKLEKENVSIKELEKLGEGSLRKAAVDGDIENGSVMAGQVAGMINEIKPAGVILEEIAAEAELIIKKLNSCGS
jgi:enoyl-[acyl-carrier protein] reductase II